MALEQSKMNFYRFADKQMKKRVRDYEDEQAQRRDVGFERQHSSSYVVNFAFVPAGGFPNDGDQGRIALAPRRKEAIPQWNSPPDSNSDVRTE